MYSLIRKYGYLTALAVFVFASASFAQTTSLTLTGVGDGAAVGGIYVDPYVGSVGGGSPTYVICDDWSDNTSVGETWTASIGSISQAGLTGTPLFGNSLSSAAQQTLYQEVAFLAAMLLQPANVTNPVEQAGISFAIWNLTYPYGTNQEVPNAYNYLMTYGTSAQIAAYNAANTALANAVSTNSLNTGAQFEILTPDPTGPGEPQEFLVETPESSSVIMFAADMFGLLALAFVFRRRLQLPVS